MRSFAPRLSPFAALVLASTLASAPAAAQLTYPDASASATASAPAPAAPAPRAPTPEPSAEAPPRPPPGPALRERGGRTRRASPASGALFLAVLVAAMGYYVWKRLKRMR